MLQKLRQLESVVSGVRRGDTSSEGPQETLHHHDLLGLCERELNEGGDARLAGGTCGYLGGEEGRRAAAPSVTDKLDFPSAAERSSSDAGAAAGEAWLGEHGDEEGIRRRRKGMLRAKMGVWAVEQLGDGFDLLRRRRTN